MNDRVYSRHTSYGTVNRVPFGVENYPCAARRTGNGSQGRNQGGQESNADPLDGMTPVRILLPIDITKCPLEVFSFINKFSGDPRVTIVLLHVVNLNIPVSENRVIEDVSCLAAQQLKRLSEKFLNPNLSVRVRVRVGRPAQEILGEARESNVDLIILTSYGGCSFWKRPFQPRVVEKVLRETTCNATVLHVRTRFNCEEDWSCVDDIVSALEYTGLL